MLHCSPHRCNLHHLHSQSLRTCPVGWLREQLQCQFCRPLPEEATSSHQAAETQGLAQAPPLHYCDICKISCAGAQRYRPLCSDPERRDAGRPPGQRPPPSGRQDSAANPALLPEAHPCLLQRVMEQLPRQLLGPEERRSGRKRVSSGEIK